MENPNYLRKLERQNRRYLQQPIRRPQYDPHQIHKLLMTDKYEIERKLEKFYQFMERSKIQRRNMEINAEKKDLPEKKVLENNQKFEEERKKFIQQMAEKYSGDEVPIIKKPEENSLKTEEIRDQFINDMMERSEREEPTIEKPELKSLYNKEVASTASSEENLISSNIVPDDENKVDDAHMDLIKSKTILIDLIDKEIRNRLNKNSNQEIRGEGGDTGGDSIKINKIKMKKLQLKEDRLKSLNIIKRELEKLENLDFEEIA